MPIYNGYFYCFFVFTMLAGNAFALPGPEDLNPKTKSIACFYYDPHEKDFGQRYIFSLKNQAYVWAKDEKGYNIYVDGRKEDGFFVIDRVYSKSFFGKKTELENSQNRVEKYCAKTIADFGNNAGFIRKKRDLRLHEVIVKQHFFAEKWSPVFKDRNSSALPSRIVLFGDSLSDEGNLLERFRTALPVGIPSPPYFLGRFSNGPVWSDYVRVSADFALRNWAFGGAQVVKAPNSLDDIFGTVISTGRAHVTGTLGKYVKQYIGEDLKATSHIAAPEKTVFVIWMGANDFLGKWDIPGGPDVLIDQPDAAEGSNSVSARAAKEIGAQIEVLHAHGARQFLLINLPNLGITPFAKHDKKYHARTPKSPQKTYDLSTKLTAIIRKFNAQLKETAADLRSRMPDLRLAEFDVFDEMEKLIANASTPEGEQSIGLSPNVFAESFEIPGNVPVKIYDQCFSAGYLGKGSVADFCTNISKSFFFDDVHPTSRAHCWIAYIIHSGLYKSKLTDVEPSLTDYSTRCQGG
jgi:phospholipase/lecithinase/hemolysin